MKKGIWLLAFAVITLLGDRFGGYILGKMVASSQFRYSRLYADTETGAAVVLLGNSRGLTFYQPEIERIAGVSTINLSYNGLPIDLGKVLVQDYIDRHAGVKTLVVDVSMCERRNAPLIKSFATYSAESARLSALLRNTDAKIYWASRFLHLYRYNSEVAQRAFYYHSKSDEDWLLDRTMTAAMREDTTFGGFTKGLEADMVTPLVELVQFAQQKGITVELVISPYYPRFAEHIRAPFLSPLKKTVEAATGLRVRDYSTFLAEAADFGDYQHPNKRGSLKYIAHLTADGVFGGTTIGKILRGSPQSFGLH
jgi:hypothetical protein